MERTSQKSKPPKQQNIQQPEEEQLAVGLDEGYVQPKETFDGRDVANSREASGVKCRPFI